MVYYGCVEKTAIPSYGADGVIPSKSNMEAKALWQILNMQKF